MDDFSRTYSAPTASKRTAVLCLAPLNMSHCKRGCRHDLFVYAAAGKSRPR
jgi:hypothetical protein